MKVRILRNQKFIVAVNTSDVFDFPNFLSFFIFFIQKSSTTAKQKQKSLNISNLLFGIQTISAL